MVIRGFGFMWLRSLVLCGYNFVYLVLRHAFAQDSSDPWRGSESNTVGWLRVELANTATSRPNRLSSSV